MLGDGSTRVEILMNGTKTRYYFDSYRLLDAVEENTLNEEAQYLIAKMSNLWPDKEQSSEVLAQSTDLAVMKSSKSVN